MNINEIYTTLKECFEERKGLKKCVSAPVIRKEKGGNYIIAAFCYYIGNTSKTVRPTAWCKLNIYTYEIMSKKMCNDEDFCNAPFDVEYDFSYDTSSVQRYCIELSELVSEYLDAKQLDIIKYKNILQILFSGMSEDMKHFYLDLINYEEINLLFYPANHQIIPEEKTEFLNEPTEMKQTATGLAPCGIPEHVKTSESFINSEDTADSVPHTASADKKIPSDTFSIDDKSDTNYTELMKRMDQIDTSLKKLARAVDNNDLQEQRYQSMHSELQKYKDGLIEHLYDSIAMDIIMVIEDIKQTHAKFCKMESTSESFYLLLKNYIAISNDLNNILYAINIEPFHTDFDSLPIKPDLKRQKIRSVTKTSDPALNKTISGSLTDGYEYPDRVLKPEEISIYKC